MAEEAVLLLALQSFQNQTEPRALHPFQHRVLALRAPGCSASPRYPARTPAAGTGHNTSPPPRPICAQAASAVPACRSRVRRGLARIPSWLGSDQLIGICAANTPPGASVRKQPRKQRFGGRRPTGKRHWRRAHRWAGPAASRGGPPSTTRRAPPGPAASASFQHRRGGGRVRALPHPASAPAMAGARYRRFRSPCRWRCRTASCSTRWNSSTAGRRRCPPNRRYCPGVPGPARLVRSSPLPARCEKSSPKTVPSPSEEINRMEPPCARMISRAIASPSPEPSGRVEPWNGRNRFSCAPVPAGRGRRPRP